MFCCIDKKRSYRIIGAAVCAAFAVAAIVVLLKPQPAAVTVATNDWGLFFEKKNMPPIPNATAEELQAYDAFYIGAPEKKLYLTFDAGFENGHTPAILDALKKHNAVGAFFLVVPYIKENPDLVKRMVAEGHLICNHTNHHYNMATKNKDVFVKELQDVEAIMKEVTGTPLHKFYRPPEGKFNYDNLNWAKEMGYKTVFWSLAYKDWVQAAQPGKDEAINKILSRTHDGAIVLLHSTSSTNAAILDELMTKWEEQGYTFESLAALK